MSTVAPADGQTPKARIAPLEPPYDADTEAMLHKWMPPGSSIEPLRLFRTLAVHGELAARMRPLGAGILGSTARVAQREREVMIHRTCALTGAEYEWGVHAVAFGRPLGLTEEQLVSTVSGSAVDSCWEERERAVFRLADELHDTSTVSGELFVELGRHWPEDQILELVITAGWYHTIAYVINACGVEREPWAERFPERVAAQR
jgi:alkylhydroperoxidase family enzyme